MAEHTVNLSTAQETAKSEMGITDIEKYFQDMCDRHIEQQLDTEWQGKTLTQKDTLLNP